MNALPETVAATLWTMSWQSALLAEQRRKGGDA